MNNWRLRSALSLLAAMLLLLLDGSIAVADSKKCEDLFLSIDPASPSELQLSQQFKGIGVAKVDNGYTFFSEGQSSHIASIDGLLSSLGQAMASKSPEGKSVELYFENVSPEEARRVLQTLELKSAAAESRPQLYMHAETSSAGNGGGQQPPRPANVEAGDGPPQKRTPPGDEGRETSGTRPPMLAAVWKPLNRRFDWSRATIEATGTPEAMRIAEAAYGVPKFTFKVVVPAGEASSASPLLKVGIFLKELTSSPRAETVENVIKQAVQNENMRRATVRQAARAIIAEIDNSGLGLRAAVEVWDMLVVDRGPIDDGPKHVYAQTSPTVGMSVSHWYPSNIRAVCG